MFLGYYNWIWGVGVMIIFKFIAIVEYLLFRGSLFVWF